MEPTDAPSLPVKGARGGRAHAKKTRFRLRSGRVRGAWWKWKIEPFSIDAVLIYAQRGHGRRASIYSDYTFALWDNDKLVPFAKAYSGLSDSEMAKVDRFVRSILKKSSDQYEALHPSLFSSWLSKTSKSPRGTKAGWLFDSQESLGGEQIRSHVRQIRSKT